MVDKRCVWAKGQPNSEEKLRAPNFYPVGVCIPSSALLSMVSRILLEAVAGKSSDKEVEVIFNTPSPAISASGYTWQKHVCFPISRLQNRVECCTCFTAWQPQGWTWRSKSEAWSFCSPCVVKRGPVTLSGRGSLNGSQGLLLPSHYPIAQNIWTVYIIQYLNQ